MVFSSKAIAFLSLTSFAVAQEDRALPDKAYCAKPRCVAITLNGDPTKWTTNAAAVTLTDALFDYDKYFTFTDYDTLCNICVKKTVSSNTLLTVADEATAYLRNWQNCLTTPAKNQPEMTYLKKANEDVVIGGSTPTFRLFNKEYWSDTEKKSVTNDIYKDYYCINNFQDFVDPCCLDSRAPSAKPTLAPTTKAPTTAAPKKNPCFSAVATIDVEGKGQISMKALQVGDRVLTENGYETVFTIDHRDENKVTDFVQIKTELENVLEITSNHLIYLHGKIDPVEAGTIKIGEKLKAFDGTKLSPAKVTEINKVARKGLYNPITTSGTILVDGIATSTYTAVGVVGESNYLTVGGFKLMSMHDFIHLAIGPLKTICLNAPEIISNSLCKVDGAEEHNFYNKIGLTLLSFGNKLIAPVQTLIVISLLSLFMLYSLFTEPIILIITVMTCKSLYKTKV